MWAREKAFVLAIAIIAAGVCATPSLAMLAAPGAGGGVGMLAAPGASGGVGMFAAPGASGGVGMFAAPGASGGAAGMFAAPGAGGGAGSTQSTPAVTSSGSDTSAGELAAIAAAGAVLVSAAGLGVVRRHTRPGRLA